MWHLVFQVLGIWEDDGGWWMGDTISECTHGSIGSQVTALRRHGQLSRLTCRQSDVNAEPCSTLRHLAVLHHVTSLYHTHQRTHPASEPWIRVICTAQLTDFFVTASSQRSTWKTGSHSLQASIGGQRLKLRKRNCWLWSCRKQEQSCKASKGFSRWVQVEV